MPQNVCTSKYTVLFILGIFSILVFAVSAHAAFLRVGTVTFTGAASAVSAGIDPTGTYAYFGTTDSPGKIVKLGLSTFTEVSSLTINPGLTSTAIWAPILVDPTGTYAYFGTWGGQVGKVRLSDFTQVASIEIFLGSSFSAAAIDHAGNYAYFGTMTPGTLASPVRIVKIGLSGGLSNIQTLTLPTGAGYATSILIDPTDTYMYVGVNWDSNFNAGRVFKINLADLSIVSTVALTPSGGSMNNGAVIDSTGAFAYYPLGTSPGKIAKVDLSSMVFSSTLNLAAGEEWLTAGIIDSNSAYAYFGTGLSGATGKIIKVRLSDFTKIITMTLNAGENDIRSAVIAPGNAAAYFGLTGYPGRVVKVDISNPTLARRPPQQGSSTASRPSSPRGTGNTATGNDYVWPRPHEEEDLNNDPGPNPRNQGDSNSNSGSTTNPRNSGSSSSTPTTSPR